MKRLGTWIAVTDTHVFQFVNQQIRCKALDVVLPKMTHIGGATFTLSSLLLIILLLKDWRFWATEALLSLTLSHVVVHFIKKVYCRERPYSKLSNVILTSNPLKDYSFPSGHTTAVFSISIVFVLESFAIGAILLFIACSVGFSRMYLGHHYPTDCISGALLGTLSSIIIVNSLSVIV